MTPSDVKWYVIFRHGLSLGPGPTLAMNSRVFFSFLLSLTFSVPQLENYIVENMKSEMAQLQQNAVQNHTATMLEIGTSLLSQTAEQTRKLTDVETQVCVRRH